MCVTKDNNNSNINEITSIKPGEKFEFSLLMHEINVLPVELSWRKLYINYNRGRIPWIEQGTYCSTYSCSTY